MHRATRERDSAVNTQMDMCPMNVFTLQQEKKQQLSVLEYDGALN